MVAFALIAYYLVLGPDAFPDYENYQTIVRNGGFLFSIDEYYFEYISRGFLKLDLGDPKTNVDLLAAVSQLITLWYVFVLSKKKPMSGLMQSALTGVVFLTTTIRAAPSYLLLGYAGLKTANWFQLFGITVLAIGWHDSAVIPFGVVLAAKILARGGVIDAANYLVSKVYWFFGSLILIADQIRSVFIELLGGSIGIREAYLTEDASYGVVKLVYIAIIYVFTSLALAKSKTNPENRVVLNVLNVICALMYMVNGVAGVRFSTYALTYFLAVYEWPQKNSAVLKVVIYGVCVAIYLYSFHDVLKNTL